MVARRGRPIGCRTSYEFADRGSVSQFAFSNVREGILEGWFSHFPLIINPAEG